MRRLRFLLATSIPLVTSILGRLFFASLVACGGRERGGGEAIAPTANAGAVPSSAPTATAAGTAAPTTGPTGSPTTTTTPTTFAGIPIPGIKIAGLPASPRAAMIGKWDVAGVDGKPIASQPGMATDPLDPATYAAGATVVFTNDTVTLSRATSTILARPYKVLGEQPPWKVTIDAGFGASDVTFNLDGSVFWSLPATPPHVLTLSRAN